MKYIYIICLVMSSFFTYKSLYATDQEKRYAFFIPNNAFQENTNIKNFSSKQVYEDDYEENDEDNYEDDYEEDIYQDASDKDITSNQLPKLKKDLPFVKKTPKPMTKNGTLVENSEIENSDSPTISITKKAIEQNPLIPRHEPFSNTQYSSMETDNIEIPNNINSKILQNTISADELIKKDVTELLDTIPYPDSSLPNFKQIYASYGLELKYLKDTGKLPPNYKQEDILAKANGVQRFKVE